MPYDIRDIISAQQLRLEHPLPFSINDINFFTHRKDNQDFPPVINIVYKGVGFKIGFKNEVNLVC